MGTTFFIVMVLLGMVLFLVAYIADGKKNAGVHVICGAVIGVVMGISSILTMPLPLMIYGFTQLNFNMLSFNFMFDLSVVLLVIIALKFFEAKRNLLKEKFGVNQ